MRLFGARRRGQGAARAERTQEHPRLARHLGQRPRRDTSAEALQRRGGDIWGQPLLPEGRGRRLEEFGVHRFLAVLAHADLADSGLADACMADACMARGAAFDGRRTGPVWRGIHHRAGPIRRRGARALARGIRHDRTEGATSPLDGGMIRPRTFEARQRRLGAPRVALPSLHERVLRLQDRLRRGAQQSGLQDRLGARDITDRQTGYGLEEAEGQRRWPLGQPFPRHAIRFDR